MNTPSLRIAHLSDLHFSKVTYGISQFFSKRWLGNFNVLLFRKKAYQTAHLWQLPLLLKGLNIEKVLVTGDLSSTSQDIEFEEGKKFIDALIDQSLTVFAVPGNHDCYTKKAERVGSYYSYFPSQRLQKTKIESAPLGKGWWYVGLDCAVATPLFCSYGNFCEKTAHYLIETLASIPKTGRVILANHFPLFPQKTPNLKHDLKGVQRLQEILKEAPQVKLYLHGHDHKHYIIDRQSEGFPLVLNSGSCAHRPNGIFYVIDLFDEQCLVQRFFFKKEGDQFSWATDWQGSFIVD